MEFVDPVAFESAPRSFLEIQSGVRFAQKSSEIRQQSRSDFAILIRRYGFLEAGEMLPNEHRRESKDFGDSLAIEGSGNHPMMQEGARCEVLGSTPENSTARA
jgi:hypothetical protein